MGDFGQIHSANAARTPFIKTLYFYFFIFMGLKKII
jgi:hypothetical protein